EGLAGCPRGGEAGEGVFAILVMEHRAEEARVGDPLVSGVAEHGLDLRADVHRVLLIEPLEVADQRQLLDERPVLSLRFAELFEREPEMLLATAERLARAHQLAADDVEASPDEDDSRKRDREQKRPLVCRDEQLQKKQTEHRPGGRQRPYTAITVRLQQPREPGGREAAAEPGCTDESQPGRPKEI